MDVLKIQKDYGWVLKVLDSCMNEKQVKTCENLFNIFLGKWSKDLSDERQLTFIHNFYKYKSHRMRIVKKVW